MQRNNRVKNNILIGSVRVGIYSIQKLGEASVSKGNKFYFLCGGGDDYFMKYRE